MTDMQEVLTRQVPRQNVVGGTESKTFDVRSDMASGRYVSAETSTHYLQELVGGQELTVAPISVTVTFTTSESVMIAGTSIPLYRVSALLDGGMTVAQVKEDFPSLTVAQIVQAQVYANANPSSGGNPYPKQSLKRLLRDSGFRKVGQGLKKIKKRS